MGVGFKRGGMVSYVTLNVSAQTGGTASGSGRFVKGRPVTVVATPGSSFIFSGWYNGNILVSTAAAYTFVLTEDISLQARFIAQYTVSVSATAGGTASGSKTANVGSAVTVTANPNIYYTFDGWYEGNTKISASASYTFTLTRNITLQARFRIIQYTISVSAATGGTASGGGTVNAGSSITLTATAAADHKFVGWYEGNTLLSASSTYKFTVTRSMTIVARMQRVIYNTGFERIAQSPWDDSKHLNDPQTHRVDYVNGVRPKSVRFYYRVSNYGGDHGYLWTSSTWTCTGDKDLTCTVNDSNGVGGAKTLAVSIRFYNGYFTVKGNIRFSCSETFAGTMLYE